MDVMIRHFGRHCVCCQFYFAMILIHNISTTKKRRKKKKKKEERTRNENFHLFKCKDYRSPLQKKKLQVLRKEGLIVTLLPILFLFLSPFSSSSLSSSASMSWSKPMPLRSMTRSGWWRRNCHLQKSKPTPKYLEALFSTATSYSNEDLNSSTADSLDRATMRETLNLKSFN